MKKQNKKNNSFEKEVAELSGYIEKEKEKDFIEDVEALIKDVEILVEDYGYTKEFAELLLVDCKISVRFSKTDRPICGLNPKDFTPSGAIIEEIGDGI